MQNPKELKLIYEGSVKRVFAENSDESSLYFQFTDDYSVFDWGKMPDAIAGKGKNLTLMGAYFFEIFSQSEYFQKLQAKNNLGKFAPQLLSKLFAGTTFKNLCQHGLKTHYLGLHNGLEQFSLGTYLSSQELNTSNQPLYLQVKAATVQKPTYRKLQALDEKQGLYFYPTKETKAAYRLIPLEVVFRLGLPKGSSLRKRVENILTNQSGASPEAQLQNLAQELSVEASDLTIGPDKLLREPIVEFYTKLEPQDRKLTLQEAAILSQLNPEQFENLIESTKILALALYNEFARHKGLELFDGKFEFLEELATGDLVLADSIGPDELRLLQGERHLSKESLRAQYRQSPWYHTLEKLKANTTPGFDWKAQCLKEVGEPPRLSKETLEEVITMYQDLTDGLLEGYKGAQENVLVIGSGGREHALAFKLAQSARVRKVYVAPGNGGTALEEKLENVDIKATDAQALTNFAQSNAISLAVIGPETALFAGVADKLRAAGIAVFGPSQAESKLEWSKAFAKEIMQEAGMPTAAYKIADSRAQAELLLKENTLLQVIKIDGLAQGKGVFLTKTEAEQKAALDEIDAFYARAKDSETYKLVLEETLEGEEVSVFCLFDGKSTFLLPQAQDHKRRFDNDLGPNTGGMGAVSPTHKFENKAIQEQIQTRVIAPLEAILKKKGINYRGVIFIGLMINKEGVPYVLEFNARFGDPETQALMPRIEGDFFSLIKATATGSLAKLPAHSIRISPQHALACVLVHEGYPKDSSSGEEIIFSSKLSVFQNQGRLCLFHSGTILEEKKVLTAGGRILTLVATGDSLEEARDLLYTAIKECHFKGMAYRKDIGIRQLKNEGKEPVHA
jgi:phosphoribosylamine--glycine ligase